jgi:fructose-bisphosphate aldolase class I
MKMIDLQGTAAQMMTHGKGPLAADESTHSADEKRLIPYGIKPSAEMRRKFRDLFLAAPGIEDYLSGVILFDETVKQKSNDGTLFPKLLAKKGILPGIKVDEGTDPLVDGSKEFITKGLIGLPERLAGYAKQGMAFTKWRAVITIEGDKLPTAHSLVENAKRLAAYALEVQKAGMVPMLEPEVLLDGKHSRTRAKTVITQILKTLFAALEDQAVDVSAVILKTSMALTGNIGGKKDTPEEVAEDTLEALLKSVPKQVPGIVFLSGGQSPDEATENLRAICERARIAGAPWPLTFSFARALQEEALEAWKGKEENVDAAREAFLARLKKVSAALGAHA